MKNMSNTWDALPTKQLLTNTMELAGNVEINSPSSTVSLRYINTA